MFSLDNKISIRQLQILLILDIFGTGVIILPKIVAQYSAQDGWIAVILSCFIGVLYAFVITTLIKMFPNKSFLDISVKILGNVLGRLIAVIYCVKILVSVALELRLFSEIARETILPATPFYVIELSLIIIAILTAVKGYETRARLSEILVLIAIVPLTIVFIITAFDVDYSNLLPILRTPKVNLFKGAYAAGFSFVGLDFCLMVSPFLKNPKKLSQGAIQSVVTLGILYTFITIITIARFGPNEITKQMWPVLEMMDTLTIPGSFIERQEGLIITFWIISVFALVNASMFFSSLLIKDLVKVGNHKIYIILCGIIVLIISFFPKDIHSIYYYIDLINHTLGIAFLLYIPLIMLVVAKVKNLGVRNETIA